MKKSTLLAASLSVALAHTASAAISIFPDQNNRTGTAATYTVSNLNDPTPTIALTGLGNAPGGISGDLTGAGSFGATDTLTINISASNTWVNADAIADPTAFGTYVTASKGATMKTFGGINPNGGNQFLGTTNALYLEFDTGNVSGAEVTFQDIAWQLTGNADEANFVLWDFETETVIANQFAKSSSLPLGTFTITTGDILVVATGPTNTGDFRAESYTFDIAAVPEPSTFALFGLGLGALCLRRRIYR